MLEVFLDALKDTALLIPFLLAVHLLIGFLEARKLGKFRRGGLLQSPLAPLVGTGLALLPQCGFSVVAGELYAKRYISVGTLVAVFIATSDEALPILIGEAATTPELWGRTALLIGIKVVMALVAGYVLYALSPVSGGRGRAVAEVRASAPAAEDVAEAKEQCDTHAAHEQEKGHEHPDGQEHEEGHEHPDGHDDEHDGEYLHTHEHGCCGHDISDKKGNVFEKYFKHPLIHTLTITLFAFVINFILGTLIYFIGEENFTAFMHSGEYLQPLIAVLVGLIPNCASSVMITELFAGGSLTLGAAVAGLSVNAGLGMAVLIKENKKAGENALIIGGLILFALIVGYALTPIGAVI